jgi:hypothetical protein
MIWGIGGCASEGTGGGPEAADVAEVKLVCLEPNVPVDGVALSVVVMALCPLCRRIRAVDASGGDLGHRAFFWVSAAGWAPVSTVVFFIRSGGVLSGPF